MSDIPLDSLSLDRYTGDANRNANPGLAAESKAAARRDFDRISHTLANPIPY